jgi:hypothetical protein
LSFSEVGGLLISPSIFARGVMIYSMVIVMITVVVVVIAVLVVDAHFMVVIAGLFSSRLYVSVITLTRPEQYWILSYHGFDSGQDNVTTNLFIFISVRCVKETYSKYR